jgi:hypothetical protein
MPPAESITRGSYVGIRTTRLPLPAKVSGTHLFNLTAALQLTYDLVQVSPPGVTQVQRLGDLPQVQRAVMLGEIGQNLALTQSVAL